MTDFMSNEQIVSAAKSDIKRHISTNSFIKQGKDLKDENNDENVYTIISCYIQWAKNEQEAELAIWAMMEEDYPEYLDLEILNF